MAAITTATSGLSNATSTWTGGVVPGAADTVTIAHPGTNTFSSTPYLTTGTLASGATSIPVSGGAGSIVAGESIQLEYQTGTDADGYPIYHSTYYRVTTGITGNGTIVIASPGLTLAIPVSGVRVLNCGHAVTLSADHTWGGDTAGGFVLRGSLVFPRNSTRSATIAAHFDFKAGGTLDMGTADNPITSFGANLVLNHSATLAADKYRLNKEQGCRIRMAGVSRTRRTTLAAVWSAGNTFTVANASGWAIGDDVVLIPETVGFQRQLATVTNIAGSAITVGAGPVTSFPIGAHVSNLSSNVQISQSSIAHELMCDFRTSQQYEVMVQNAAITSGMGVRTCGNPSLASTPANQVVIRDSAVKAYSSGQVTPVIEEYVTSAYYRSVFLNTSDQGGSCYYGQGDSYFCTYISRLSVTGAADIGGKNGVKANCVFSAQATDRSLIMGSQGSSDWSDNVYLPQYSASHIGVLGAAFSGSPAGITFLRENFSKADGANRPFFAIGTKHVGKVIFDSCLLGQPVPIIYGQCGNNAKAISVNGRYASAPTVFKTEAWLGTGYMVRNDSIKHRGLSSIEVQPKTSTLDISETVPIAVGGGRSISVLIAVRKDATLPVNPSVTLSINGTADVVQTLSAAANTWQVMSLSITNPSAVLQEASLKLSVPPALAGSAFFSGIPVKYFVLGCRWYGYLFDESNAVRVADPTITLTESAASALTGIAINHTAQTITLTAARTAAEVYCYCVSDLVNNLDAAGNYRTRHITSSDGASFATTYTVVMGSGGSIAGRYSDANGAVVSAAITGIVAGSRILIKRTDTQAVLENAVVSGTSYSLNVQTASAIPISVTVRKASSAPYYQEWATTGSIDPVGGFAAVANQQPD